MFRLRYRLGSKPVSFKLLSTVVYYLADDNNL